MKSLSNAKTSYRKNEKKKFLSEQSQTMASWLRLPRVLWELVFEHLNILDSFQDLLRSATFLAHF